MTTPSIGEPVEVIAVSATGVGKVFPTKADDVVALTGVDAVVALLAQDPVRALAGADRVVAGSAADDVGTGPGIDRVVAVAGDGHVGP